MKLLKNKYSKIISFFITLLFLASNAQASLVAYFNSATFLSPKSGPYLETYLTVVGSTAIYIKDADNQYRATVEITIKFTPQGADSAKIVRKYNLRSQPIPTLLAEKSDFIDIQRISLPQGAYTLELEIADKNATKQPYKYKDTKRIFFPLNEASVSDIEFVDTFNPTQTENVLSKNKFDLLPYVSDYYPPSKNKLNFYCEIYGVNKRIADSARFLVRYSIHSAETHELVNNFSGFQINVAREVNPIIASFLIDSLPTGNYYVLVEIRDQKNNLLVENSRTFKRRKDIEKARPIIASRKFPSPILSKALSENDTLLDYVLSLFPIAKGSEKKFIYEDAKASDPLLLKQFFINFWSTRNPTNPEGEWLAYQREVLKVNAEYGTKHHKGYQTDRGRVFLQYGPPDNLIRSENEPNIYPYEIWQYYKINEQSNKRFIFYVNELSGNNYKLLHSDVSGEIYNANWQYELQNNKSANDPNSINNNGNHIQQNYNDLK